MSSRLSKMAQELGEHQRSKHNDTFFRKGTVVQEANAMEIKLYWSFKDGKKAGTKNIIHILTSLEKRLYITG